MHEFNSAEEMMDRVDAIRRSSDAQRRDQEMYVAYNRAMDNGHQWIQRTSMAGDYDVFINKTNAIARSDGNEPMLTTVNRITRMSRRVGAALNPQRLEVHSAPPAGSGNADLLNCGNIMESVGNAMVGHANLLSAASRASQERVVGGQQGFGFRIITDGKGDAALEGFEFDGYRLSLDPMNRSNDLREHHEIVFTDVITWEHAVRMFGEDALRGIKKENLRSVSSLLPVETRFHQLTNGRMYAEYAQHQHEKALVISWYYVRGIGSRFDRLYIMADTGGGAGANGQSSRDRAAIKFEDPSNPYGGNGLNFMLLNGFFRSGSRMPVSHVALMVDDQVKANIAASIHFQGMWSFVKATLVVDKAMLKGSNTTEAEILKSIRRGALLVNRGGDRNALPPAWLSTPPPSQVVANEINYWANEIRSSGFHAGVHEGETKTHVPAHTTQLALDESTMPLDDIQDADVRAYTSVIETLTLTSLELAKKGARTIIQSLKDAGITDSQFGFIARMPTDRVPCTLILSREGVVRRSRARRYQEALELVSTGAMDPGEFGLIAAELDMPVSDEHRDTLHYCDEALADVVAGREFMPAPLEHHLPIFKSRWRRVFMANRQNIEVAQRLYEAFDKQMEVEAEVSGVGELPTPEQAPEPAFPPEVTLDQVAGLAPIQ